MITSFDDLTGVNVCFWAKLLDMIVAMAVNGQGDERQAVSLHSSG